MVCMWLMKWVVSWMYEGRFSTSGRRWMSRNLDISTVGHAHPETIGLPGLFSLWILGKK